MTSSHPLLIDGNWVPGSSEVINLNPSDLDNPLGTFAVASADLADQAIEAAAAASSKWASTPATRRAEYLQTISELIVSRKSELAVQLSAEEGKTLKEAAGEVGRAASTFAYFAHQLLQTQGEVLFSHRPNVQLHTRRRPLGVVAVISPWNFPLAVPAWKIAPALAAGNTVVFKPAAQVPASAWSLAKIIDDAGVPAGVFNLVTGSGRVVGEQFSRHPLVNAITFTGSTAVGQHILASAHATDNRRVQAEMGGKNSLIVLDDADLKTAVAAIMDSAYGATGQRCTASSRIIVTPGIHDQLVEALIGQLAKVHVGHALNDETTMGPVASAAQLEVDLSAIQLGIQEGAEIAFGGEQLARDTNGYFLEPTLFVGGQSEMRLNQDEIFGPVACIIQATDVDEAISVSNDVVYGLSSGIITESLSASEKFQGAARVGLISVNTSPAASEFHAPFGGVKASSYGPREQGSRGMDFYTEVSTHSVHFTGI